MEASEEKRKNYKQEIETIPTYNLVYIDESGIELAICKDKGWGKKAKNFLLRKVENTTRESTSLQIALITNQ